MKIIKLFLILVLISCKHEVIDFENVRMVCFKNEIQPIFSSNCNMCHNSGVSEAEFDFSSYEGIMSNITKYKPDQSYIYQVITSKWGKIMPPPPKTILSKEQRTLINLWILQGADTLTCDSI